MGRKQMYMTVRYQVYLDNTRFFGDQINSNEYRGKGSYYIRRPPVPLCRPLITTEYLSALERPPDLPILIYSYSIVRLALFAVLHCTATPTFRVRLAPADVALWTTTLTS